MRELKKAGVALCVGVMVFILAGFGPKRGATIASGGETDAMARHIAMLKTGRPQQKAAAAYWLGQQRSAAAGAVDRLLEFLGDATEVDAKQYRQHPLDKMTLGEEVAAALVNIGHQTELRAMSALLRQRKFALLFEMAALCPSGHQGAPIRSPRH